MDADGTVIRRGERRARVALGLGLVSLALAGVLAAATRVTFAGHWYGLFLLRGKDGPTLELKDDLVLGDGSRLLVGLQFAAVRRLLGRAAASGTRLELDWDEREGSGMVTNHLADGTELITLFSRYTDSQGNQPHGLFVGGALPEIAADPASQSESGMTLHDSRGWTHIWCNVNEAMEVGDELTFPGQWRFLGSRVHIRDPQRAVLESSHEVVGRGGARLRVDRFAYFKAGEPWFKLGIRVTNVGEAPARYSYIYGDEPWVGEFGSGAGNVGWVTSGLVGNEAVLDTHQHRWAGIYDEKSGAADFLAWVGDDVPDDAYFSNTAGPPAGREPLTSNEVFIAVEWLSRTVRPGESRNMLLAVGMGERTARGPRLPPGLQLGP